MVYGVQAILGRIAEIEGRLQTLDPQVARPAEQRTFAQALQSASQTLPTRTIAPQAAAVTTSSSSSDGKYDATIERSAARYGLDPKLVHAVIKAESDYDPRCHSHAGAMGLMQLMPETCKDYGITDPYDPTQNIEGGCRELSGYFKQFKGNAELALAAYNAGPNAVRRYGGIPPYRETQAYVPRVIRYWRESQ